MVWYILNILIKLMNLNVYKVRLYRSWSCPSAKETWWRSRLYCVLPYIQLMGFRWWGIYFADWNSSLLEVGLTDEEFDFTCMCCHFWIQEAKLNISCWCLARFFPYVSWIYTDRIWVCLWPRQTLLLGCLASRLPRVCADLPLLSPVTPLPFV